MLNTRPHHAASGLEYFASGRGYSRFGPAAFAPPRLGRKGPTLLVLLLVFLTVGCGDSFRPIANPVIPPGGDPQQQRQAVVVNNNNGGAGTTMHVDTTGDSVVAARSVGNDPVHAALSPFLNATYVANRGSDTISIYNPAASIEVVNTATLPAGSRPSFVMIQSAANVFIANIGTNTVGILNTGLNAVTDIIPVGQAPVALTGTPDGRKVYSANSGDNTLSVISVADKTAAPLTVGTRPVWLVMTPDGILFSINQGDNTMSVIATSTDTIATTVPTGASPRMGVFESRLRRLYVVNSGDNTLSVFNADNFTLIKTVPVGGSPSGVAALADGSRVYVANSADNTVSVVDAKSLTVRKTIPVGTTPIWIDSTGDSTRVLVANRDSNSVSDISTLDDTVIRTLPTSSPHPVFLEIEPR